MPTSNHQTMVSAWLKLLTWRWNHQLATQSSPPPSVKTWKSGNRRKRSKDKQLIEKQGAREPKSRSRWTRLKVGEVKSCENLSRKLLVRASKSNPKSKLNPKRKSKLSSRFKTKKLHKASTLSTKSPIRRSTWSSTSTSNELVSGRWHFFTRLPSSHCSTCAEVNVKVYQLLI